MFFLAPRKGFQYSVNISLKISVQRVPEVKKEKEEEEEEEISFLSYHKLTSKIFRKETNGKGSLKRISFE